MTINANINIIKSQHEKELLSKKGVTSIGIGFKKVNNKLTNEISIICGVKKKLPLTELSTNDLIPKEINGHKTDVIETDEIKALQLQRTDKIRPTVRGISVGHYKVTAGTIGCVVKKGTQSYILSNNHVLANSNDSKPGDMILQQGSYDGGTTQENTIGRLFDYVPILFDNEQPPQPPPSTCSIANTYSNIGNFVFKLLKRKSRFSTYTTIPPDNKTDAAIYEPISQLTSDSYDSYEGWGKLTGYFNPKLGDEVKKSGRTTGSTYGIVTQIYVTSKVSYGTNKTATFIDQFIVESIDNNKFSSGGDSGSIIQLKNDSKAIGLLFAGSDTVTVCNKIENVLDRLNITL